MGSASETSNRSFGESEDGKASKITTEDENLENKTDAGTSVMSEELDDQKSSLKDKSITSSKGQSRKRRTSTSEMSIDRTMCYEDKPLTEDSFPMNIEATNSNKSTNSSRSKKSRLVPLDESVLDLVIALPLGCMWGCRVRYSVWRRPMGWRVIAAWSENNHLLSTAGHVRDRHQHPNTEIRIHREPPRVARRRLGSDNATIAGKPSIDSHGHIYPR